MIAPLIITVFCITFVYAFVLNWDFIRLNNCYTIHVGIVATLIAIYNCFIFTAVYLAVNGALGILEGYIKYVVNK